MLALHLSFVATRCRGDLDFFEPRVVGSGNAGVSEVELFSFFSTSTNLAVIVTYIFLSWRKMMPQTGLHNRVSLAKVRWKSR